MGKWTGGKREKWEGERGRWEGRDRGRDRGRGRGGGRGSGGRGSRRGIRGGGGGGGGIREVQLTLAHRYSGCMPQQCSFHAQPAATPGAKNLCTH